VWGEGGRARVYITYREPDSTVFGSEGFPMPLRLSGKDKLSWEALDSEDVKVMQMV